MNQILGLKCYRTITEVNEAIDVAYIFRPSNEVLPFAQEALAKKVKVIWLPEGVYSKEAAEQARHKGVIAVWNRCMKKEHQRLMS